MSHNRLLIKPAFYRITGSFWNWLSAISTIGHSVLRSVMQFPILYQCFLVCLRVASLAPAFLIYIDDLSLITQFCNIFLFADDAKLCKIILHSTDHLDLQQDLDQLYAWSIDSDLLFSIDKLNVLIWASITRLLLLTQSTATLHIKILCKLF